MLIVDEHRLHKRSTSVSCKSARICEKFRITAQTSAPREVVVLRLRAVVQWILSCLTALSFLASGVVTSIIECLT